MKDIKEELMLQLDRLMLEKERIQKKVATEESLKIFEDFETLSDIRTSLVFLVSCLPRNLYPKDCKIKRDKDGNLSPVSL